MGKTVTRSHPHSFHGSFFLLPLLLLLSALPLSLYHHGAQPPTSLPTPPPPATKPPPPALLHLLLLHFFWLLKHYRIAAACWLFAAACVAHRFVSPCLRIIASLRRRRVFIMDFVCYKPRDELKCNYEVSEFMIRINAHRFSLPSMDFQRKIFERSGLGEETYLPAALFKDPTPNPSVSDPQPNPSRTPTLTPIMSPTASFADAREEAEDVLFGSVGELLLKTNVKPQDISIVVTNCSLHCPTPSYASMIVTRFKLGEDVKAFHLAGMGCSASLIACKLASDLLRARRVSGARGPGYALVVSTENITLNYYFGNEKPMLVTNCLFRVGCAAILLTDNPSERARSKYELLHCIRTHKASDDKAYGCAYQSNDGKGFLGVSLNKNLMGVAADALRTNIRSLGPLILPIREQLNFVTALVAREIFKMRVKQYQPDFKTAVDHFCIHAGGRAVIDEIQKNLYLNDYLLEPARATLHRWGNTSASCVWYVLAYMECKERVKAGHKVWMLGLGSGFKCNSAVLKAVSDIPASRFSAWADCIHRYPEAYRVHMKTL